MGAGSNAGPHFFWGRRGTLDLILHQESDREPVEARVAINQIEAGDIRPSTCGQPDKRGSPEAETAEEGLEGLSGGANSRLAGIDRSVPL